MGGTGEAGEPKRAVAKGNEEVGERIIVATEHTTSPQLHLFDGMRLCKHQIIFCKRLSAQQQQKSTLVAMQRTGTPTEDAH